jgi:hypothetical protein
MADRTLSQVGGIASGLRHAEASRQPYVQQVKSSGMLAFFFLWQSLCLRHWHPCQASHGGKSDFLMFRFSRKKTEKQVDGIWSRVLCLATSLIMHAFHMCVLTTPNL